MNLLYYETLASQVIDAVPGSTTESAVVEQMVASIQNGRALAVMDAMFRQLAHELFSDLPAHTDPHQTPIVVKTADQMILSEPELEAIAAAVSYVCGDPDHAISALQEYHDSATSIAEAQISIAALIKVAKHAHTNRITMSQEEL